MPASEIPIYRPLVTISPQVAECPRILPSWGEATDFRANTVLDPRILSHGGVVDLTHVFPQETAVGVSRVYVPRHLSMQGSHRSPNGTRLLSPLQSAYNELVRAAYDADPRVTSAQRRAGCTALLANLRRIAAQDFRQVAMTETIRFRVPGALKVCVVDERLKPGEVGLSRSSIKRMFGGRDFTAVLVGRYPTFTYLPAIAVCLERAGDAVAVSPAWTEALEMGEPVTRTFLDELEGDCDGDLLSVIPAPNAECAAEIISRLGARRVVDHADMSVPVPAPTDLRKDVGGHLDAAMAKAASKEYIRFIITCLYRSWTVFNLCNRSGIHTGLTRGRIAAFWKAICEGVFDLKHDSAGVGAAEGILLCFRGDKRYTDVARHIEAIEKMPADGPRIGRLIWEMPYRLGLAAKSPIRLGDLNAAAGLCRTWSVLQDMHDGPELVEGILDILDDFGIDGLGGRMLADVFEEVHR